MRHETLTHGPPPAVSSAATRRSLIVSLCACDQGGGAGQALMWTGLRWGAYVGGAGLLFLVARRLGFRRCAPQDPLALRSLLGLMSRGGCRLIFIVSTLLLLRSGTTGFIML